MYIGSSFSGISLADIVDSDISMTEEHAMPILKQVKHFHLTKGKANTMKGYSWSS
jgi:hypothetical protein